jgi:hypothetical protein
MLFFDLRTVHPACRQPNYHASSTGHFDRIGASTEAFIHWRSEALERGFRLTAETPEARARGLDRLQSGARKDRHHLGQRSD